MNKLEAKRPTRSDKLMNNILAKQKKIQLTIAIDADIHLALKTFSTVNRIPMKQIVSEAIQKAINT